MKIPKTTNRYCPYCKKKTEQKIKLVSTGAKRGTLTRGSKSRARKRGQSRGIGNKGKYSKPAVTKFKRKTKTTIPNFFNRYKQRINRRRENVDSYGLYFWSARWKRWIKCYF